MVNHNLAKLYTMSRDTCTKAQRAYTHTDLQTLPSSHAENFWQGASDNSSPQPSAKLRLIIENSKILVINHKYADMRKPNYL